MEGGSALGGATAAAAAAKVDFRVSGARFDLEDRIIRSWLSFRGVVVGDREEKIRGEGRREREREEEERRAILRRSSIPRTARNPERATVLEPTPETMSAGRVAVLGALTQRTSPQAINEAFA